MKKNLNRRIYLTGEISNESYEKFSKKLNKLEEESDDSIHVVLMSYGGDAYAAMAFYDRIRISHVPIVITACGLVASAATLILSAGTTRYMTKNAWVMVHEDVVPVPEGANVTVMRKITAHSMALESQWNKLLEETTKLKDYEWARLNEYDSYLTPETCLEYGLIDRILE